MFKKNNLYHQFYILINNKNFHSVIKVTFIKENLMIQFDFDIFSNNLNTIKVITLNMQRNLCKKWFTKQSVLIK